MLGRGKRGLLDALWPNLGHRKGLAAACERMDAKLVELHRMLSLSDPDDDFGFVRNRTAPRGGRAAGGPVRVAHEPGRSGPDGSRRRARPRRPDVRLQR